MMNHTVDFYHCALSPPSRAALLAVNALGIKHNVKNIDVINKEQLKPEFLKINPLHTIPALDDGGFRIWDSHVIMKYLSKKYAKDDSLFPNDPKKAAQVEVMLHFGSDYLFRSFSDYIRPVVLNGDAPNPEQAKKIEEALEQLNSFLQGRQWIVGSNLTIADFLIIATIATIEAIRFPFAKYSNVVDWYNRAKEKMAPFGYEQINQKGASDLGAAFLSRLQ